MFNILVFTCLNTLSNPKAHLIKLVYFLERYRPHYNILYHNPHYKLPNYVKNLYFDCIVFDATFLSSARVIYRKWLKEHMQKNNLFDYVANSEACKLAFPQDDYEMSDILDEMFCDLKIDYVFSIFEESICRVLYPNFSTKGRFKMSYTGYIDSDYLEISKITKSYEERKIDISYRTSKLPPYFGKVGELKWRLVDIFKDQFSKYNLKLDISYSEKDIITGNKWYDFLGDSKFCLGSLSGSSIIDKDGSIKEKMNHFIKKNKNYDYNELIEELGIEEEKEPLTVLSPRNIEAGFTKTCQILVIGPYSGYLKPWVNYIPIEIDWKNFRILNETEIIKAIKDKTLWEEIVNNTFKLFLDLKNEISYESLANKIDSIILEHLNTGKIKRSSFEEVKKAISKYKIKNSKKIEFEKKIKQFLSDIRIPNFLLKKMKKNYYKIINYLDIK